MLNRGVGLGATGYSFSSVGARVAVGGTTEAGVGETTGVDVAGTKGAGVSGTTGAGVEDATGADVGGIIGSGAAASMGGLGKDVPLLPFFSLLIPKGIEIVGTPDGASLGESDGASLGKSDGASLGKSDVDIPKESVVVGASDGAADGALPFKSRTSAVTRVARTRTKEARNLMVRWVYSYDLARKL